MAALATRLEEHAHELTPFSLAGTAWAYASLGGGPDSLFQTLALEARDRIGTFEFRHVATFLHALSRLGLYDKRLVEAAVEHATGLLAAHTSMEETFEMAPERVGDDDLLRNEFIPQSAVHLLVALANLQHPSPAIL